MLMRSGEVVGLATSRNLLLGRLCPADGRLLLPYLERVAIPRGTRLQRDAERIETVYFPEAGLLTIEESIGRRHVEVAVVGREGMLGWQALLGCERSGHDAIVQVQDGRALCIRPEPLIAACRASMTLWTTLLGFVQTIMGQMARTIASHVECSLEQRVARWVLMRHDRVSGDQMLVRHDEIAAALNARRASITDRLHILEGGHLIRCHRGRIIVRDRGALEHRAGDAYGAQEQNYQRLTAPP